MVHNEQLNSGREAIVNCLTMIKNGTTGEGDYSRIAQGKYYLRNLWLWQTLNYLVGAGLVYLGYIIIF